MVAGRCEGCGATGSVRKLADHILACGPWQALYARDRALALSPEESHRKWKDGGRAQDRAEHLLAVTSGIEDRRVLASARWNPPDILDD